MRKILVIEDSLELGDLISSMLNNEGYRALSAYNGEDGIKKALENIPDLIICDFHLPDKNANVIHEELKANFLTRSIPFIFLTGDITLFDQFKRDSIHHLRKPFTIDQLLRKVDNVLY